MTTSEIPKARDIMTSRIECLHPEMPIGAAVHTLLRRGYPAAPVVDEQGKLLGVLSEHDCIRVLASAAYEGWPEGRVVDYMQRDVDAAPPEEDLFSLAQRFTQGHRRRVPVCEDGRLVGMIMRKDLVRALDERATPVEHPGTYALIQARRHSLGEA